MTAQQPYSVLERWADVEIRHYPEHTVAEVVVAGDFDGSGNQGFRPLFGYIQGGGVAMTAPVVQTPVEEGNAVAFVMPEDRTVETLPEPADPRVHLRVVGAHDAAALRFSGWGNAADLRRRGAHLLKALEGSGWSPIGPVRMARFNAPFIPPFLRHNEVVVEVQRDPAQSPR
jgi:hypothetical protein